MGIHGIFKEIGQGQRISLAKLAADHYVSQERPFRLAIDISIWLFQIQAGKGGSNPALRTFYYRLLRLLTLNIHPLFVFDGPNKPLFKRNKKVGGPGVRVASVPEFLAKQLLKQFGFPWHVAPGEAEAECALLQRESIVDAVLSEDVDTLMFGSNVTLRNWSTDNTSKTPTHVNLYRADETKETSGLDRNGMVLVALMSGGDYIVEGIPGCGPKLACAAARAGFGKDLCTLAKHDFQGLQSWRESLQHQIRTNEAKYFTRRNTALVIPDDFPSREVLGYYTHPCVSTAEKLVRLKENLKWDQPIDFPALRTFAADAFDWRCLGGAKKFIRNLAPAMLVRELRLREENPNVKCDEAAQREHEGQLILAIHGKRNHSTTDGTLEYRVSFIPASFVSIDLSIEDEDEDFVPAGGVDDPSDGENQVLVLQDPIGEDGDLPSGPPSPMKVRHPKPYHPDQPEKIWIMRDYLKVGCPLMVEEYESTSKDPKEFFKARRNARTAGSRSTQTKSKKQSRKRPGPDASQPSMSLYAPVSKLVGASTGGSEAVARAPLTSLGSKTNARAEPQPVVEIFSDDTINADFTLTHQTLPATGKQVELTRLDVDNQKTLRAARHPVGAFAGSQTFTAFAKTSSRLPEAQKTPQRRKRRSPDLSSPALSQRTIESYWSPSPRKHVNVKDNVISLLSSPQENAHSPRPTSPTLRASIDFSPGKLPDTVTKRRKKAPLKRSQTAPVYGEDSRHLCLPANTIQPSTPSASRSKPVEAIDLASPSPARSDSSLPSPSTFLPTANASQWKLGTSQRATVTGSSAPDVPPFPLTSAGASKEPVSSAAASVRPLRRSPRQKTLVQLRQSLAGSWREVNDISIDLSNRSTDKTRTNAKGWRMSGVEVLDLTED